MTARQAAPALAAAGINNTINFQGRLLTASGSVVPDGNYNMEFRIYQDGSGAAAYNGGTYASPTGLDWSEDWLVSNTEGVVVKNGYFSVSLGSLCSLSGGSCQGATNSGVNWNDNTLWLSMDVAGGGEATASCGTTQALFHQTWNGTNGCSADGEMLPMRGMTTSVYAESANGLTSANGLMTAGSFIQNQTASAQAASYWIQGTADIAPTATNVNALSVTGTTGATAATAAVIAQGGGADGVDINVTNASGTAGAAIAITKTGAGALTNGISFTGTDTADLYRGSGNLVIQAASGNLTLSPSTGTITMTGTTPTVTTSGAANLAVDTGGAATLNLGASNATTIALGSTGTTASTINIGQSTTTTGTETVNIATAAGSGGKDAVTIGGTGSSNNTVTIQGGTAAAAIDLASNTTVASGKNLTVASGTSTLTGALTQSGGAVSITGNAASSISTSSGNLTLQGGSGTVTLGSTATLTASGALAVDSGGANTLTLDTGGSAALHIAPTNATSIIVGGNSSATIEEDVANGSTSAYTLQTAGGTNYLTVDTSNHQLIVGVGATGEATPQLLVLDNQTGSATDPTGANGSMYYNASTGQFRCYEQGVWFNCVGPSNDLAREMPLYSSDFLGTTSSVMDAPFNGGNQGSGGTAEDTGSASANHPGIVALEGGAATGGGYHYSIDGGFLLGPNYSFEAVFILHSCSGAEMHIGFLDNAVGNGAVTNGAYFRINSSCLVNGITSAGGTQTSTALGVTLSTGTWYRATIQADSSYSSIQFKIYNDTTGAYVGGVTNSTNLPTGTTGAGAGAETSTTTSLNMVGIDYMAVWVGSPLTRL